MNVVTSGWTIRDSGFVLPEEGVQGFPPQNADDRVVPQSAREAVEMAVRLNTALGHENNGFLSLTHGFAPRLTPVTRFPPDFEAWNQLRNQLPYLISSRKLHRYCERTLPILDATQLPPVFALHAATVIGYTAHAYWNLGENKPGRSLPASLESPWRQIHEFHLGRGDGTTALWLGIFEQMVGNFRFEDGKLPPPAAGAEPCPWASDELARYGSVEYDPLAASIDNFYPSNDLTGSREERVFYGIITESHTAGAPVVRLVVEAQEAMVEHNVPKLKHALSDVLDLLHTLTFGVFDKIQQQRKSTTYCDASIWCKVVAPIPAPVTSTSFGPSGAASPLVHLLDAFFGRTKYEQFIGKEVRGLFHSLAPNWKHFIVAVWAGPSLQDFVACVAQDELELQSLFGACLRQYAGENGFLGRHKLKTVGYIEIGMKLGREVTLGGFAGLLKDRAWDQIGRELGVGQKERFDITMKSKFQLGRILEVSEETLADKRSALQVRIDIEGSGIKYEPGSRVGVLYESSADQVHAVLLAFADGDSAEAVRLGEEYMVELNPAWIRALRQRQQYHNVTSDDDPRIPKKLPLKQFLKWGNIRPATHQMLRLAHQASGSREIRAILHHDLVSALTFSDVVTLLKRSGVNLLPDNDDEYDDKDDCPPRRQTRRQTSYDFSRVENRLLRIPRRSAIFDHHKNSILEGTGLTPQQRDSLTIRSRSTSALRHQLSKQIRTIPQLCEIVEPAGVRPYSVASSSLVHPNELHLYVEHVQYNAKSAVVRTSPLLADTKKLERRRGAASDYIVTMSLPRYQLAIEAIEELTGVDNNHNNTNTTATTESLFYLSSEAKEYLKSRAQMSEGEITDVVERAKDYEGGEMLVSNLRKAIVEVLKGKPDTRDKSIVLVSEPSPRFQLPASCCVPCIMIAGGSGLAPFRSFWQTLATRGGRPAANGDKHLLIIQQRTRRKMAFEDEILMLVKAGIMDVEIMFSRDECLPDFTGNKIIYKPAPGRVGYIDKIIESDHLQERLAVLIRDKGAHMYLCGRGGLARTAVESLDRCLCRIFGDDKGKEELEKMVAEKRMVLDIFTSLSPPHTQRNQLCLSELCQCNDFVGNHPINDGQKSPLYLVIGATVYDVENLLRLHPGGDLLIQLYCGMDATKAWDAVQHSKAPEVAAMLEMFDTKLSLRSVEDDLNNSEESDWYVQGWKEMTMLLVETQNALSLAFQRNWDRGSLSSSELDLGEHYTVWEGKAIWRPKRSMLKGQFFADTHNRLWSIFLPSILSDPFDEVRVVPADSFVTSEETEDLMEEIRDGDNHLVCDAVYTILKEELDKACASADNSTALPPSLQSYMEELRMVDEMLLHDIKAHLVTGLQVFEKYDSPLLPAFNIKFKHCIVGIVQAVQEYTKKVASLSAIAFGLQRMLEVGQRPSLKRGGLTLLNSHQLDSVERNYIDVEETKTKTKGGEVDVESKLKLLEQTTIKPKAKPLVRVEKVIPPDDTEETLSETEHFANY